MDKVGDDYKKFSLVQGIKSGTSFYSELTQKTLHKTKKNADSAWMPQFKVLYSIQVNQLCLGRDKEKHLLIHNLHFNKGVRARGEETGFKQRVSL